MTPWFQILILGIVVAVSSIYLLHVNNVRFPSFSPNNNLPTELVTQKSTSTNPTSTGLGDIRDPRTVLQSAEQNRFIPNPSEFRGPVEKPNIIGPSGNPPNY